jgi:hypothetical protein
MIKLDHQRSELITLYNCSALFCSALCLARGLPGWPGGHGAGRATASGLGTTHEDVPDWWPYAAEFPRWHVWQGVCGLVYARRPRTSPPVVVRGEDAVDLRNHMRRAEGRMTPFKGSNPGPADKKTGSVSVETVRSRPMFRVISIDVFEPVGVCPVRCIGVAARVAAWSSSVRGSSTSPASRQRTPVEG